MGKRLLTVSALFAALLSADAVVFPPKAFTLEIEKPVSITTNQYGVALVDFGRDAYGWLEFVSPAAGYYSLALGEIVRDGSVWAAPINSNIRYCRLSGQAEPGVFRVPLPVNKRNTSVEAGAILTPPHVGVIMPFRAVELARGPFPAVTYDNVRRVVVRYGFDLGESSFRCSNPKLEKVWAYLKDCVAYSTAFGLFVDGDRERLPYEGDSLATQLAGYAAFSDAEIARATFRHLMDRPTWPTEGKWCMVMMAWNDWKWTGNTDLVATWYDRLVAEKLFGEKRRADGLLVTGTRNDLTDWPWCERDGFDFRPVNAAVNAYYHRALEMMSDLAAAIGKAADARRFADEAATVRATYDRAFYDAASGLYVDGEGSRHSSLHANALALAFGLVPEERRSKVADFVESRAMRCSPYFMIYVLEALRICGREKAIFDALLSEGDRSWLGMIDFGATMGMEAWNLKAKPNLDVNHSWVAVPLHFLARWVLGVRQTGPGWTNFVVEPHLGSLDWAEGDVPTPKGIVHVRAERRADGTVATKVERRPLPAHAVSPAARAAVPWTHLNYQNDPDDFQFAIVPDRTGGDYRGAFTNALAKVNMMHPEFVITVGDLIQGYRDDEGELRRQQIELTNMTAKVVAPFFTVVGNHDIGRSRAIPPGYERSNEIMTAVWREFHGQDTYYSFVYKNVLFVCLNTMEAQGARVVQENITAAQYAWFKKTLDAHPNVRWTLVFMHQPAVWTTDAWMAFERDELAKRPYTVFAGDWHTYIHARRRGRDYYVLSVAGGCSGSNSYGGDNDREKLMGVPYGEMDHITWVTMTKDGPDVVNLLLDGILPGDFLDQSNSLWTTRTMPLDYPVSQKTVDRLLALKEEQRRRAGVPPPDPLNVNLFCAQVVCCNTNSPGCVKAAAELKKHLAIIAGKNEPEPDGFVFAVGEIPPGEAVRDFESCAKVSGGRLCFWGDESRHGSEKGSGALFAVYEFLDKKLGVKWMFPGDEGIVFTNKTTLSLKEGEAWRVSPRFDVCRLHGDVGDYRKSYGKTPEEFCISEKAFKVRLAQNAEWFGRMRLVSRNGPKSGHVRSDDMCYAAVFPRGLERFLFDDFKTKLAAGSTGYEYDGVPRPVTDLEYYVLASLMRDPDRRFGEIVEEFYSQYGAAAPEAKAYFEHVRARAFATSADGFRKPKAAQRPDDGERVRLAVEGQSLEALDAERKILRPGESKHLHFAARERFARLVLRAEHARLTYRFLDAFRRGDASALASAADALYAFRLQNLGRLGYEGPFWFSDTNCERPAWRQTKYFPASGGSTR